MNRTSFRTGAAALLAFVSSTTIFAQDDAVLRLAQPDFTLISLPTSLPLPTFGSAFRVTHRFGRPLGQGDFGDLLDDLFGLDSGAVVGLEFRYGLVRGGQVGVHRSANGKVIEFFGQYVVARQGPSPLEISALVSVEGENNFRDEYSPGLGAILTRTFSDVAAIHLEPIWIGNTGRLLLDGSDDSTFVVGLGARLRVRPTVYLTAEFVPRVAGFDPGVHHTSFAVEKRAGGHVFQVNVSNSLGTTLGQLARGGATNDNWHLGFNISRKFF